MTDGVRQFVVCWMFAAALNLMLLPRGRHKHGLTFVLHFDEQKVLFHSRTAQFDWAKQAHQKPLKCQGLVLSYTTLKTGHRILMAFLQMGD